MIVDMYDKRIQRGRFTEQAKKDAMSKITFIVDLKEAVKDADFIIEAVPEIMDLKKSVSKKSPLFAPMIPFSPPTPPR
jgi:3-hydroxybutyryl-CoA dehydrogenase